MSKKEQIVEAALVLLTENGIHATPMSLIAKKAGTGMGTIYNYFENKEELVNAIYVSIKERERAILEIVFEKELPVKVQFESYYRAIIGFFLENAVCFRFMEQLHASPIISQESRNVGMEAIEEIVSLLEKGQKEQIIKDLEVQEILQFIGGTVMGYLRSSLQTHQTNTDTGTLSTQIRLVWDAIKA